MYEARNCPCCGNMEVKKFNEQFSQDCRACGFGECQLAQIADATELIESITELTNLKVRTEDAVNRLQSLLREAEADKLADLQSWESGKKDFWREKCLSAKKEAEQENSDYEACKIRIAEHLKRGPKNEQAI